MLKGSKVMDFDAADDLGRKKISECGKSSDRGIPYFSNPGQVAIRCYCASGQLAIIAECFLFH